MKTPRPPRLPRHWTLRRPFAILTAASLALAGTASAADWFLSGNQPYGDSWDTLADWNSHADGTGSSPGALSATDTFHLNGFSLRTPAAAGPVTFGGGLLHLTGGASSIGIKTTGAGGAIIPALKSDGGKIENANGGVVCLAVGDFEAASGSTLVSSVSGRTVNLAVTTLVGAGELRIGGGGSAALLTLTDATGYTGRLRLSSGNLDFDAPVSSSGDLLIEGGTMTLDQPLAFTAVTIGGTAYPAGTYSYAALQAAWPAIFTAGSSGGSITVKPATTWYLIPANQPSPEHWMTATDWSSSADGTGGNPAEFRVADTFDTNGRQTLRTPFVGAQVPENTFKGGRLIITGSATTLALKATNGTALASLSSLYMSAGKITQNANASIRLHVGLFENQGMGSYGITLNSSAGSNAGIALSVGKLVGAGKTRFSGANATFKLSVDDASAYTGEILLAYGKLDFDNDLNSTGRLVIDTGALVNLDQSVTFTGLNIAGTEYGVGTYTYAALQAAWPAIFTSGTSGGAIIVRPPLDWRLTTSQTLNTYSWNTLAHWNSAADGSGIAAGSINAYDNYIDDTSGRTLRTPEASEVFGGGALVLQNGGKLMLRNGDNGTSTIPAFSNEGNATICNGVTGVTQNLVITDWDISSGTTSLQFGAANLLNLTVDILSGDGTLTSQYGGNYVYNIRGAQGFTGTIRHYSGSLTFGSQIGSRGNLVVESGAAVTLDQPGFFTGATIAGSNLSAGYHSYASLHAAYPAQFPAGSASAFLAIYAPDTTGPAHMFGVNLAGGEGGAVPGTYGYDYIYPSAAEFDYYHSKGLDLIRVPFKWERLQGTLNGALNAAELSRLDTVVGYASARGMKVILDMHNYARRKESGVTYLIGNGPVTLASFGDVWRRIADHYKGNAGIYGYGIMNEPYSTNNTWPAIAQTAVNAIRTVDLTSYVIVGGDTWSNAVGWRSKNPDLDTQDPVGRLLYEAHCYFDNDNSGTYDSSYDGEGAYPMIGVDRVAEFVGWLQERGAKGFIGEYGVPGNDSRWLTVLDNFLSYLNANGVSGTYWAGGPWWGSYALSCEPTSNFTVDKPQMAVLKDYP